MMRARFFLPEKLSIAITTCLQEAIMNAILHGNLEIKNRPNSPQEMDLYQDELDAKLSDNYYSNKRICIRAWDGHRKIKLSVGDEGMGFSLEGVQVAANSKYGMGLRLIRELADSIWLENEGRSLVMEFGY